MHVDIREHLHKVGSLFPPVHRLQGLNSGQAWLANACTCRDSSPAPMCGVVLTFIDLCGGGAHVWKSEDHLEEVVGSSLHSDCQVW